MMASATATPAEMREKPIDCIDVILPSLRSLVARQAFGSVYQRPKNTDSIEIDTPFGH